MARKVYISSDIAIDDELGEVADISPLISLLWPWILTVFDDWGRAEASPKRLKKSIFPGNPLVTDELLGNALQLFAANRLIRLYDVDGKRYMAIDPDKWFSYQTHIRKEKRNEDKSKVPAPPDTPLDDNSAQMREIARAYAEASATFENDATLDFAGDAQMREIARDCTPSPSLSPSLSPSPSLKTCSSGGRGDDPFVIFQSQGFGKMDDLARQFILDDIEMYSEPWVVKAMKEAVIQNKKSWSYVTGILSRWKKTGHDEPWTLEKETPEPQQQSNVTQFKRNGNNYGNRNNGRVKPEVVAEQKVGPRITELEIRNMLDMAHQSDGKTPPTEAEYQAAIEKLRGKVDVS